MLVRFFFEGVHAVILRHVCRQGKAWSGGDAKAEERLMARLFRLLRCGRLEDARQLCHHVGQPWRAASLGSAGGLGLTPLGGLKCHCPRRVLTLQIHLCRPRTSSAQQRSDCHADLCLFSLEG